MGFLRDFGLPELVIICLCSLISVAIVVTIIVLLVRKDKPKVIKSDEIKSIDNKPEAQ
jgi:hypothetical protein